MILSFHHANIIIPVGQDDLARKYYGELLGMKEIEKPASLKNSGGLWFQLGNAQLHLSYEKRQGVDPRQTMAHLAYLTEDLNLISAKLSEQGHIIKDLPEVPHMIRFETQDPFGHRVEIIQIL